MAFAARYIHHLRRYDQMGRRLSGDKLDRGAVKHLVENGLGEWISAWKLVHPFTRLSTEAWGDPGCCNARMERDLGVWQAARRMVGYLLGMTPRTLRRRAGEVDYWGQQFEPLAALRREPHVPRLIHLGELPAGDVALDAFKSVDEQLAAMRIEQDLAAIVGNHGQEN